MDLRDFQSYLQNESPRQILNDIDLGYAYIIRCPIFFHSYFFSKCYTCTEAFRLLKTESDFFTALSGTIAKHSNSFDTFFNFHLTKYFTFHIYLSNNSVKFTLTKSLYFLAIKLFFGIHFIRINNSGITFSNCTNLKLIIIIKKEKIQKMDAPTTPQLA